MAKLRAPLFSFGASGKLANSLVYFGWKGLSVVRSYVIPANPKTTNQLTVRARLTACVAKIHFCQGMAGILFGTNDATSYALLGSLESTPRTWFNTICKQWLDQKQASLIPAVYTKGSCVAGALKATITITIVPESGGPTDCAIRYGTSKSNLINTQNTTPGDLEAGVDVAGLVAGTKYYFQVRATAAADFVGTDSGIWSATPTAA